MLSKSSSRPDRGIRHCHRTFLFQQPSHGRAECLAAPTVWLIYATIWKVHTAYHAGSQIRRELSETCEVVKKKTNFASTTYISNNTGRWMVQLCSFNAKTGIFRFLNCKPQVPSFPIPHLSVFQLALPTKVRPLSYRVTTPILRLPAP